MLRVLALAFLSVITITAVTTPLVYSTLNSVFSNFNYPFSRVFDRVAMFWIVIGIYFYRKTLFADHFKELKHKGLKNKLLELLKPFNELLLFSLLTLLTSFLVTWILLQQGIFELREYHGASIIISKTLKIIISAFFISIIEELFFRYLIISEYVKKQQIVRGILTSSLFYALCHFISPVYEFKYNKFDPLAGFYYIEEISKRFLLLEVYHGVLGLFLVGLVLALVFIKTRRLNICIGLHAGWIASLKLVFLFIALPQSYQTNLALTRRYILVAHPYTWISIISIFILFIIYNKNKKQICFNAN